MSRLCSVPGCTVPVVSGRCAAHQRPAWTPSQPVQRIRGRRLQRMRDRLFQEQPLCVLCLQKEPPMFAASVIRDHIQPVSEGGTDDPENIQALCEDCHAAKTREESLRGRTGMQTPQKRTVGKPQAAFERT